MNYTVALEPNSNNQAFIMGVGRYRGDSLQIVKNRPTLKIRFQGYTLIKTDAK
jgi:hypothetical protein